MSIINLIRSYFLPFTRTGDFDIILMLNYAKQYMFRNGIAAGLLFGISGIAKVFEFTILHYLLFAGSCIFATAFGLFLAATVDSYRS